MVLLWQDVGFNRIRTVPNRCPTVARSMSATGCCSQSTSPPNCGSIHVSRMLLLAECTSPNRYLIYASRMMLLAECVSAKPLPDLRQPHSVARSVVRSMSAAYCCSQSAPRQIGTWSTSATWCCSQSASRPNRCPIYVSRIVSLTVLSDLRQPHSVARSVVRSTSAA